MLTLPIVPIARAISSGILNARSNSGTASHDASELTALLDNSPGMSDLRDLSNDQSAYTNTKHPVSIDTLPEAWWNSVTGNIDYQRQLQSAVRAEEFSAREAQKQRDWEEYMSNTAYTRSIKDLKANGINPYAIGMASPASTPSGATGQAYIGNAVRGNPLNFFSEMLGIAKSAMQMSAQREVAQIHASTQRDIAQERIEADERSDTLRLLLTLLKSSR